MSASKAPKSREDPEFPRLEVGDFFEFPNLEDAADSIVAVGGNLSPGMMLSAYAQGIFPWFNEDDPLYWHSPPLRFVLLPQWLHIPSRLKREIKKNRFRITADEAFDEVIASCANAVRPGQDGTWLTGDLMAACIELHNEGFMHSVEAWDGEKLAGGFYGMQLGRAFFGESMFFCVPGASKAAFAVFAQKFFGEMGGSLIDSQVYTDHVARFGAKNISRQAYLRLLRTALFEGDCGGEACDELPLSSLDELFMRKADWKGHFA